MLIQNIDLKIIALAKKYRMTFGRIALFVIFFWFGILKVLGFSPADGLVKELLSHTIPFMEPNTFVFLFGLFEMLIGIMFLIKGLERVVIFILGVHMITTFMPLVFLPSVTWTQFFVPTLEGQYIIKNLVIIAVAISIAADLKPFKEKTALSQNT